MMNQVYVPLKDATPCVVEKDKTFAECLSKNGIEYEPAVLYNFGTKDPREVNRALIELIGVSELNDDPKQTKLDPDLGSGQKLYKPELWQPKDKLALDKVHTVKVRKRLPPPAISLCKLTQWFLPKDEACEVEYQLEGAKEQASKVDCEVHASEYYAVGSEGQETPSDTMPTPGSTHIWQKLNAYELTDARASDAKLSFKEWNGESQATKGVLEKTASPYIQHACAPYCLMLRFYKDDADKDARLVLKPFYPRHVVKDRVLDPTKWDEESFIVKWSISGDNGKLKRGQLILRDKDEKVVLRAALDTDALQTKKKYDLLKGKVKLAPTDIKADKMPYRVEVQAHSEGSEPKGVAVTAMHTVVRAYNYTKAQFIAFNVKPGCRAGKYLGEDKDHTLDDIHVRAGVMNDAIRLAFNDGKIDKSSTTLKIFMAPEFYWRGQEGGYSLKFISEIPKLMRKETDKFDYADWLFVLGTSIGYLKHEQLDDKEDGTGEALVHRVERPVYVEASDDSSGDTVLTVHYREDLKALPWKACQGSTEARVTNYALSHRMAKLKGTVPPSAGPATLIDPSAGEHAVTILSTFDWGGTVGVEFTGAEQPQEGWTLKQNALLDTVETRVSTYEVTLEGIHAFKSGAALLAEPSATIEQIVIPKKKFRIKSKILARVPTAQIGWRLKQGGPARSIGKCTLVTDDLYEVELNGASTFVLGPVELVEPISTEVFNTALVLKGWPAEHLGERGLKRAVVQKETISSIDYLGNYQKPQLFNDLSGVNRLITIHGETNRKVLPTDGSTAVFGASPQNTKRVIEWDDKELEHHKYTVGTEVNASGEGGGTVVGIDGITFGIEVCLDHLSRRLRKFYDGNPTGTPKVQIQLIPSWGMSIKEQGIQCIAGTGLIFNVDGSSNSSAARLNDGAYGCAKHPTKQPGMAGKCDSSGVMWVCTSCGSLLSGDECLVHGPGVQYDSCKVCTKLKPVGAKCSSNHAPAGSACNEDYAKVGTPIHVESGPTKVPSSEDAQYFLEGGYLMVYKETAIPAPEVV